MSDPQEESRTARAAAGGDLAAMEALFNEHKGMVFAVGLSVCGNAPDADEVVQEAFLRAFRSLDDWRGDSRFSTWLYMIAMRTALNWKTRFVQKPRLEAPEPSTAPDPGAADREEQLAALTGAIAKLPLQQRLVVTLRHVRGLSLAQIADVQGCALGTVKSNLHHAIVRLREILEGSLA
jgi:RNA polymerase sigma-70 factor (ECF subfamily)